MAPDNTTIPYRIQYEQFQGFLSARVEAEGDPATVAAYYTEACCRSAKDGYRKLLVDSYTRRKHWTFDDAERVGTLVAEAATTHGILAIAVVAHDPESNRDAEHFAVQVFKNIATEGKYFHDDIAAARAWIQSVAV
ncbi:MAG: hypothetical protein AAF297_05755 [Planctomycetota bacterium]